jgi:DNA-binding transcriptional regulator YiaG
MTSSRAGDVVSLRAHAGYQPDFQAVACGLITAARIKLGLDHDEFADYLAAVLPWAPTAAVVRRWEEGANPPADVALAALAAAQDGHGDVLTLALTPGAERRAGLLSAIGPALDNMADGGEAVTPYADRGLITRQQWNGIISGNVSHLWLYGMAEYGYAYDDEVPGILADAAARGCQIRVLLLHPGYADIAAIDADEGSPAGTLAVRTRAALARFGQMRRTCGSQMEIRTYNAPPTVSVVRGDDRMFVTPYLRFFVGSNSPTFEIRAESAGKMFSRYARHFESTWDLATGWEGT